MTKKGSVLIISLWILAILVVFAVSLAQRAAINLRLVRYQRDRLKTYLLAKAGINQAIAELSKDSPATSGDNGGIKFNLSDEESKININTANGELLQQLFIQKGLESEAVDLAQVITEWINVDNVDIEPEEEKKIFKNEPFRVNEELLLVLEYFYKQREEPDKYRAKGQGAFNQVKDLITVYGDGKINANTASEETLSILANAVAEDDNEQKNCVALVIEDLIRQRQENYFKNPSEIKTRSVVSGTSSDENLYNNLKSYLAVQSNNFRIESLGSSGKITRRINAVYDRVNQKLVYWHEG